MIRKRSAARRSVCMKENCMEDVIFPQLVKGFEMVLEWSFNGWVTAAMDLGDGM